MGGWRTGVRGEAPGADWANGGADGALGGHVLGCNDSRRLGGAGIRRFVVNTVQFDPKRSYTGGFVARAYFNHSGPPASRHLTAQFDPEPSGQPQWSPGGLDRGRGWV
jgi:hypothetical protein